MASIGLSRTDCIEKYGSKDGYIFLSASEEGTNKMDMERIERCNVKGFIEIRATKIEGQIVGMTACRPALAELVNEIVVVIENKLTVRDVARSLHSYPSYGLLLHRILYIWQRGIHSVRSNLSAPAVES
mmetsp:Transcript_1391/g.1590  ORF Transcript_1391/g.1590 Transcript_1391/m.1590 type:complete len:129 (-) Transcript_1391:187-573(-)